VADGEKPPEREADTGARLRSRLGALTLAGAVAWLLRGTGRRLFRGVREGVRSARLIFYGLIVVALSVVTCSYGVDPAGLTREYGEPIPATKAAATDFLERAEAALLAAPDRRAIRITLTQEEATSVLSLGLMLPEVMRAMESVPQERMREAPSVAEMRAVIRSHRSAVEAEGGWIGRALGALDPDLRTGDTQVRFTADGEVVMGGYVQAWSFKLPALLVVRPRASSGELVLDFVQGRLGRLPAPEWIFDRLGDGIAALVLMGREHAEVSEITVRPGRLVLEGRLAP